MKRTGRDPVFLRMAAIAGTGGVFSIVFAIGLPLWSFLHGRPTSPGFALFAAWGIAALAGSYACLKTYAISDVGPRRPPRGGLRLITTTGAAPDPRAAEHTDQRAA